MLESYSLQENFLSAVCTRQTSHPQSWPKRAISDYHTVAQPWLILCELALRFHLGSDCHSLSLIDQNSLSRCFAWRQGHLLLLNGDQTLGQIHKTSCDHFDCLNRHSEQFLTRVVLVTPLVRLLPSRLYMWTVGSTWVLASLDRAQVLFGHSHRLLRVNSHWFMNGFWTLASKRNRCLIHRALDSHFG